MRPSNSRHVQVAKADVLVPTTGPVDAQALRSAKRLKLIVQPATGYSNIDVETAAELGIPVCNSPGAALQYCLVKLFKDTQCQSGVHGRGRMHG